MAVRFIVGRAGSGKTHHCLEAIRQRLHQDPIEGPRLIFLVPEQASLQMERAILQPILAERVAGQDPIDVRFAAHRAEVLSFRRLAHRVLEAVGDLPRRALSESARSMVLRHLTAQRWDQLVYYQRAARQDGSVACRSGFIHQLSLTIAELLDEAVGPDELNALADANGPSGPCIEQDDPAQGAKFHDLQLIYRAYLDYLGTEKLDPSQHLQVARCCFPRCSWLEGCELWVDGFASFSGQETLTLLALARMAGHVDVTVMMDPILCEVPLPPHARVRATARLFSRPYQTYQDLHDRFIRAGLEVETSLRLGPTVDPSGESCRFEPAARFRTNDSLARLERSLFIPAPGYITDAVESSSGVELVELPSRRIEVDYAVSRVCRWAQDEDQPYRYREMAIIARDLEGYHDHLREALDARGIPFFIDRRRSLAHHPLVELLRAVIAVAAESLSLRSVRLLLKTDLWPIAMDAADELENYLLAHGLGGVEVWRGPDWSFPLHSSFVSSDGVQPADDPKDKMTAYEQETLARINAARRNLYERLEPWLAVATSPAAKSGKDWSAALLSLFDRLHVEGTLAEWIGDAEADGDLDQAEEHRQVWRDLSTFLDDLAFAFGDVPLTIAELADVLEAGLSGLTVGLVPPMVDQLLVGSIERSRHPDIKAVVLIGFNDGLFPKSLTEDSILNDDDRARCRAGGLKVRPAARERIFDEATLAYVALTRASETLVITYAVTDDEGKAMRVSPYGKALAAACAGLKTHTCGDPIRSRAMWDLLSMGDVAARLVMEFRSRPALRLDDSTLRARWNNLYDVVRMDLGRGSGIRALTSLRDRHDDNVAPATIERLYGTSLTTSVSQLETYAACPFQHFARYVLRLEERAEARLEAVDVGQVHHAILEDFMATVAARGERLADLTEEELIEGLRESCGHVAERLPTDGILSDARNAYLLRRSASDLARVIQAQRNQSRSGRMRPWAAELPFGFDKQSSLPPLVLSTPAGRRVLLRGYIDRVDLAELNDELLGIVIDYKRTREKRLDLRYVYHGLSLQLLSYLLVLAESGATLAGRPVRPIGSLYVSLSSQYLRVDHPSQGSQRDVELRGTYRPRGLLRADTFTVLDPSGDTGWSDHYSVYRKKDGQVGHMDHSDSADARSFEALLNHTRTRLGQLADGILDGCFAVKPFRLSGFSPCNWCAMSSVCRFEMGISDVRFLESLKRSEVFEKITQAES